VIPWLKSFGQGFSAVTESEGLFHVWTILCSPFEGTEGLSRSISVRTSENHTLREIGVRINALSVDEKNLQYSNATHYDDKKEGKKKAIPCGFLLAHNSRIEF
jgi:chemotaxis methyl-accepting protein methylase